MSGQDSRKRVAGGSGCDIVAAGDEFQARRGHIYAFEVREDDTQIASVVEDKEGTLTRISAGERTWLGVDAGASSGGDSDEGIPTLLISDLIVPDYPLKSIHVVAGSVLVYYEEYGWKHYRR
jgi:hypothetical protein